MSELHGQSAINSSVIHTAPGCHSVLDCDPAEEEGCCGGGSSSALTVLKPVSPRTSGPEEQWEEDSGNRRNLWVNQQLKLQLHQHPLSSRTYNSSLAVFPYSESRPVNNSDSFDDPAICTTSGARQGGSFGDAEHSVLQHCGGSVQSSLSRVTVSHHHHVDNKSQQEIRCIGMSSAFLSRFNNSFRT